ncbi:MAG: hypothetical protein J0H49_25160 [Acidobacteria bacterium]|nr:hypothetical protein [Acidobacteriota bacterium]
MSQVHRPCAGLVAVAFLTLVCLPLGAQRLPTNYTVVTFRKVAPEKVNAFLSFTMEQTKKVMQARIDSGGIKTWTLLKLTVPYSAGSDYNYVMVVSTDKFPDLDPAAAEMDATYKKVGLNRAEYLKTSRELSTLVHQEINRGVLRVGPGAEVGNYVRVDYHVSSAERPGELMEMERSVYAPMFKEVIEANKGIRAWAVSVPMLPTSGESGYTLYTTQTFKDSASLGAGAGTSQEVFRKVHPERNYMNTMGQVRALDRISKVRIYHVLEVLGSPILGAPMK